MQTDQEEVRRCENAACSGVPGAMYRMGRYYEDGEVVPADPLRAIEWYERYIEAAQTYDGDDDEYGTWDSALDPTEVHLRAGMLGVHFHINGTAEYSRALKHLRIAAKDDHIDALLYLSQERWSDPEQTPDDGFQRQRVGEAMDLLQRACAKGSIEAMLRLGEFWENGMCNHRCDDFIGDESETEGLLNAMGYYEDAQQAGSNEASYHIERVKNRLHELDWRDGDG